MSTNTMIGKKSNGEFTVPDQLFAESYQTIIGNQAALQIGQGSSIGTFDGIVRGQGNAIHVEPDVTIAGLYLEIDGDNWIFEFFDSDRYHQARKAGGLGWRL